ncbi:hypothetical protein D3C80_555950 [compost metagenome]
MPLFRHEPRSEQTAPVDPKTTNRFSAQDNAIIVSNRIFAGNGIKQFRLAIAGDAGNGKHLARPNLQRDILERNRKRRTRGNRNLVHLQ